MSPDRLDALIASRVAHLRLLAARTAQAYWRDQPDRTAALVDRLAHYLAEAGVRPPPFLRKDGAS